MAAVGQIGTDGIVAGHLAMMRIVAPGGTTDFLTRAQHRAIDVDRQCAGVQIETHDSSHDLGVEPSQRFHRGGGKAFEPATDAAVRGQILEATKAPKQGIALHMPQVAQTTSAHHQ